MRQLNLSLACQEKEINPASACWLMSLKPGLIYFRQPSQPSFFLLLSSLLRQKEKKKLLAGLAERIYFIFASLHSVSIPVVSFSHSNAQGNGLIPKSISFNNRFHSLFQFNSVFCLQSHPKREREERIYCRGKKSASFLPQFKSGMS